MILLKALVGRAGFYLITLLFLLTATFSLMKAIPGDPFSDEKGMPKEVYEASVKRYGLDKPYLTQLGYYLGSVLTFDFGLSIMTPERSVNAIIKDSFPVSLTLGLSALFLAIGGGLLFGGISAAVENRALDSITITATTLLVAIPNFCVAILLQYTLSVKLGVLPLARWGTLSHAVLPTLALSLFPMAYLTRLIRANISEVRSLAFVKTAYAKGLSPFHVASRHIIPNALLPAVGYLGQLAANIIVGSFVIEKIFSIPGIGGALVKSVLGRDYPAIMGLTAFFAYILFASVFASDLLAYLLDPRIRRREVS
ncbi:ABC transporter permease [Estrella lausannensis]|uniref:ABC-type transporter, permease subunit n=1 Tax=Estrella lausannensis TaxID=483423 RepID=A0A0H5E4L9_9BACT|nr:ABC transporter permease [Estrella lausannensis]CRX38170.1 ABC-type transporter, permease subunit [Estrella lausannensis]